MSLKTGGSSSHLEEKTELHPPMVLQVMVLSDVIIHVLHSQAVGAIAESLSQSVSHCMRIAVQVHLGITKSWTFCIGAIGRI